MWQVDFFIAVEREHERQRELERRRALRDAALDGAWRADTARGGRRRLLLRLMSVPGQLGGAVATAIRSALDRPVIGPHHL